MTTADGSLFHCTPASEKEEILIKVEWMYEFGDTREAAARYKSHCLGMFEIWGNLNGIPESCIMLLLTNTNDCYRHLVDEHSW